MAERHDRSVRNVLTDIDTARLILRPLREEDRAAMIELHTDPRTTQFESDPPDAEQVDLLIDSWLMHWTEHGFGYCAVSTRTSPIVVGLAGIRLSELLGEVVLNLAYRFSPDVWGRGYAAEAARAMVDWRARTLPRLPLVASVKVANERSCRVAERIGFAHYTEELHDGARSRHYRLEAIR